MTFPTDPTKTASQDAPGSTFATEVRVTVDPKTPVNSPVDTQGLHDADAPIYINHGPLARGCPNCKRHHIARRAGWLDDHTAYILWPCCNYKELFRLWP